LAPRIMRRLTSHLYVWVLVTIVAGGTLGYVDPVTAVKVIAQLMGHAKVDTTLNVYAQVLDGSVREAAERVGSRLITIDHSAPEVATVTH